MRWGVLDGTDLGIATRKTTRRSRQGNREMAAEQLIHHRRTRSSPCRCRNLSCLDFQVVQEEGYRNGPSRLRCQQLHLRNRNTQGADRVQPAHRKWVSPRGVFFRTSLWMACLQRGVNHFNILGRIADCNLFSICKT